ncbi:hypothetical protein HAX54_017986 [Datura stramonium]|uniref:Uncharacterized protein n=1 Tax=Datura stramonium TaxID=4076 RepID=A0ABS8Y3J2_DATST|nr:hypothetical protein [Datura stramonium]
MASHLSFQTLRLLLWVFNRPPIYHCSTSLHLKEVQIGYAPEVPVTPRRSWVDDADMGKIVASELHFQ